MPEVIDLTLDSPSPADAEKKSRRERKEEKRERAAQKRKRKEETGSYGERKHEDEHDRESTRKEHRTRRSRDDKDRRDADGGKRRRESSRERDDRKRSRREREREPSPIAIPDEQLFYLDAIPAELPAAARYTTATPVEEPPGLILPAHVSVFGETPAEIIPTEPLDSEEDDYIEYLDYDNRKDFVRYYEEQPEEKRTKIICKKCGEEGHIAVQCTVLICSTCGARDDHPTHRCNVGKTCFNCGMKGHINSDCPNRRADRWAMNGCERCDSSAHQTSECPSLWRIYVYVEEAEHDRILQTRKERKGLSLGQGGEGYIARDACCYNCGGSGHWGDDCREFYHSEPISDPTAFSYHWLTQGPYAAPEHLESRAPREWVNDIPLPGGVENVGRQARRNAMEKLARRAQKQQEADDDPTDWFQNMGNGKRGERESERSGGNVPTGPRKMAVSSAKEAPTFHFGAASSSKMSLMDRLTDPGQRDASKSSKKSRNRDSRDRASDSRHRNDRDRDMDKYRERDKARGPRYNGGYSR